MTTPLTKIKAEHRARLLNWMARRLNEVLKDDRFDSCYELAQKILPLYEKSQYDLSEMNLTLCEALVKSRTMTDKINLLEPAMRVSRSNDLLSQLWLAVSEDKCIAVMQFMTEP